MRKQYRVAEHLFSIDTPERYFAQLSNYAPFAVEADGQEELFVIQVHEEPLPPTDGWSLHYTDRSDEDMPRIEMYRREEEWMFCVSMLRESAIESAMVWVADRKRVDLYLRPETARFAIDNTAMLIYAFATAHLDTLLFHASVTVRKGKGFLFLGHSGTGKSTHSQQWLKAFEDAQLLNDDNPIVRILPAGTVNVYGSPWSGKTKCYINAQAPVGALVQLAQAPENKIKSLRMTQAYPYILSSVSGLKILPEEMDAIYNAIARLLETTPVYYLECLPDTEAAQLCAQTCLS